MKLKPGDIAPLITAATIHGKPVVAPEAGHRFTHLQFRRFAGCPVCNFHLHSLARRADEIAAAGVRELVFFHSSAEEMLAYQGQLPFDCVADPAKTWYRAFGVESSWLAPLHPRVLWSGLRGVLAMGRFYRRAENGILGLPADFLLDRDATVVSAHYGRHADDSWGADDLLQQVRQARGAPRLSPART